MVSEEVVPGRRLAKEAPLAPPRDERCSKVVNMSGYWFDSDLAEEPKPRETQLELAEWVQVEPRRWERRVREWE